MSINVPKLFQKIFGSDGQKFDIPVDPSSDWPVTESHRAAYSTGFPSVTMIPKSAGGKPPFGKDFNGVLNDITANLQFIQAGMGYPYNADFSAAIGGYPMGALLLSTDGQTLWKSTDDSNTTDPDSAEASGWQKVITEKTLTDRFTIIYPNGGSEASPANITINQRYTMPNPFPGRIVACQIELYYGSVWGVISFTQVNATASGVGAVAGQVNDTIIVQTGSGGLFGSSAGTGNLFSTAATGITTAPCRVKVWCVD